ncbi:MAG TPA: lipocalin-like domain-containing protein, partial [Methanoregula sp.]|nr:lipocalin-like domain-containing protein [Methanoregula sp.]
MTSKKAIAFLTGLILVLSVSATALAADELYGAWRLVSYKRTLVTTGETTDVFGKSPKGSITFGRDG